MAGRIAGITIKIGADGSDFTKTIKKMDSELGKTQAKLKDVKKLLKLDPKNTELLTQKQKSLEKAISGTKDKLEALKSAQSSVAKGTDEWDALQREIVATEQDLKGLEQEYRNFGSVGAQQVAAVGEQLKEAGGKIEGLGKKLAPVSKAAAGAIVALGGLALSTINAADDLATLSQQTGISTDELQKMQYASDFVDVSLESITGALKKMKSKMDPANETFKKLGVSVTNTDGSLRGATEVFYDSLEALSQIDNEVERDQVAMELFGKSADELAGIIDDGGEGLKQYGQEAEDLGLILSEDTIDSMLTLSDTLARLKNTFSGAFAQLGATLAETFAPALEKVAEYAQQLAEKIAQLTPEQAQLIVTILGVVAAIAPLLIVGGKLVTGIGNLLDTAPKIVSGISTVTKALTSPIGVTALVIAAVVALGVIIYKNWDKIVAWTQEMIDKIKAAWADLKTSVTNAVTNLKTNVSKLWNTIKSNVTSAVDKIKSSVTNAWDSIKSSVSSTVSGIYSTVISKFNMIRSTASGIWNGIKNSISTAIEGARQTVSEVVDKIKSFFTDPIKIQFKLPKISMGEKEWSTFAGTIKIPWPSITWEKKAYANPVMFTRPTVLGTPNGYYGFGDGNGAEIVMGLNKLRELVGSTGSVTVNVYPPAGSDTEAIAAAVEQRLVAAQRRRMRVYA